MAETEVKPEVAQGLAGVVIGDTTICTVNQTQLLYRGYEIADLAAHATFEEVAHLLLVGHKPSADELRAFNAELASLRPIPDEKDGNSPPRRPPIRGWTFFGRSALVAP